MVPGSNNAPSTDGVVLPVLLLGAVLALGFIAGMPL
ncbi:hypothetical protein GGR40_000386 [Novosphingobium gossypii]